MSNDWLNRGTSAALLSLFISLIPVVSFKWFFRMRATDAPENFVHGDKKWLMGLPHQPCLYC